MAYTDLCLDNLHQVSVSYPFLTIDASINADTETDADAWCGQGSLFQLKAFLNSLCSYSLLAFGMGYFFVFSE